MKIALIAEDDFEKAYRLGAAIASIIYEGVIARDMGDKDEIAAIDIELQETKKKYKELRQKVFGE